MSDPAQNPNQPEPSLTPSQNPTEPTNPQPGNPPGPLDEPAGDAPANEEPFDAEKLTLPEGLDVNSELWNGFKDFAKETGMKQSHAQRLVNDHVQAMKAHEEAIYNGWHNTQREWQDKIKNDPELGPNLEVVRQTVSKVMDNREFTDPEFRQALNFTGAGSNPAIVRTLYRWAKALTEGGVVQGEPPPRNADGSLANQPQAPRTIYGQQGPHSGGPKLS